MDGKVFSASGAAALMWFAFALGAIAPAAQAQISTHDQPCAGTNFGGNLGCTANDVSVLGGFRVQGGGAITCQAGEDVIVDLEAVIVAGNASRYDVAMFVGETANDPQLAASGVNNQCTVTTLPTAPLPLPSPFAELDGDVCGDIDTVGGDNQETLYMDDVRIRCNAGPDGRLIIPYVLTWKQSGDNQVCNNPPSPASALAPGAVSKCNTAPVSTPAVIDGAVVLGYVQIDKATVPAGVAQSFDFTAASSTAGVTPSQSGFSMTDATAPVRITIPVNSTGRNLTITESALAGWDLTGLTCTTPSGGSAAGFVTVNTATREVSATLSSTNAAVHCTYTNTRQTRVRTVKALSPTTDPGLFNLTAGPATVTNVGHNGTAGFTAVAPGVSRTFAETAGTGTALANYATTYVCTDNTTGTQITSGTGTTVSFVPPANDDTTCTFTNTRRTGAVTLTKAWTTPTSGDTVSLAIGGASGAAAGSSIAPSTITPATATGNAGDTITVSEAFSVGSPANYTTALSCLRTVAPLTAVATSGTGLSRTFVMPADSGVACTWSNTGPAANLAVTKSAPTGGAFAGQSVSWNIVVTNNGPATASNIVVTDSPTNVGGITLSSATPGCSGSSCTFASLANGASITVTATGTVSAAGAFDNAVSAIANTFDPNTADNTDATGNGGSAGPAANLAVSKSNGGGSVDAGGSTQYVVRVTNNGPSAVTGAMLTDTATAGLSKTAVACSATPGQCTAPATPSVAQLEAGYALPALANGQFYEIVVTASVGIGASVSNTATIAVPGGTLDPDNGNDSSTDTDTVAPVADLALVKAQRAGTSGAFQTTPLTVSQGDTVQYRLTITNNGPSVASGATFTDAVPAGFGSLVVISAVGANGATNCAAGFTGNTLDGTFSGPAAATCTVIVQGVANDAAASPGAVNTASTTLAADPTPASSSVNTIVGPSANLVVTKSDGVSTVSSGASTIYIVRVTNNGPSPVTGAVVTDPAATGLAKTATACTAAGGNACSAAPSIAALEGSGFALPALASGAFFEFTVTATVTAASGDDVSNTASVAPPGGVNDPAPGNNSVTDINDVGAIADLAVTKTQRLGASGAFQAAPLAVFQGDLVQYRILIENNGPSAAAGATFSDPLPANFTGVALVSATPAGGATCNGSVAGNTLSGSFDGPPGSNCAVIVQGTADIVAAGGVTNTASTTLADDPTPASSSVSTVIGPSANLSVVKSNGASGVVSGADTTYVVRVENAGPSAATGAVLRDPSATGLTKISAACTGTAGNTCSSSPAIAALEAPGGVVLPAIPAGGFYEITVTATVDATDGSVSNVATITPPAGTDDPVGGDDSAQDTDTVGGSADLAFDKSVDNPSPTVGDTVVFTLTVANAGPSAANGVVVADQLPGGYTYVSDDGGGAYVPGTGVWIVGTVNAGGNATLAITATVDAAGSHTNSAQITASDTPDPDSTPNDGAGDDFDSVTPAVDFLPDAVNDSASVDEDDSVNVPVLGNDSFGGDGAGSIALATPPADGSAVLNDAGTPADPADDFFEYTPDTDFNGSDSFTYTITDGNGDSDTATVTITIAAINDAPDAVDDAVSVNQDASATVIDVLANDTDADTGTTLTVTAVTQPANGTVTLVGGVVSFTPAPGFAGTTTFTYTISDGNGGSDTATVTITVDNVNDDPNAVDDSYTVAEDSGATLLAPSVLANDTDPDAGDTRTITANTNPANGTVSCTATDCTYTPDADFTGTDAFTYTITDGSGATDTAAVSITVTPVNDAPVANDDTLLIAEDAAATPIDVLLNDFDVDAGTTLTVTANTNAANGTVTCTPTGCTYQPDADFSGTDSFTYTISDGNGGTDTGTVNITVGGDNDAPVAGDDSYTVSEDSGATLLAPSVLDNDNDADNDTLSIQSNTPAANGSVACTATDCTYTPNADFTGSDSFTYTVSDGNGGSDTATVTITVTPVNDAPDAVDDLYAVAEDSGATTLTPSVLANDLDIDAGDTLSITANTNPADGTVSCAATDCTYTPDADFTGSDSFTYTITDGSGATDTATVTITVTPANDAPDAIDDAVSVNQDAAATVIDVLANDTDIDAGTTLTVTVVTQPANGTVTLVGGVVSFTPAPGFVGTTTFTYTISDGNGGMDTATVTVTVDNVNDAPVAGDDGYTVAEDSGATLLAPSVLLNDSDVDAGDTLTITANTNPANGTVSCTPTDCTYTPDADFTGTHSFTYTITDGSGATDTATVTITVTPVNDAPNAVDDTASVNQDAPATVIDVLANDTDIENDTLTVTAVTQPANGTVTLVGGVVSFTPAPGFVGTTTFTYTISDGNGGTGTATVTITVDNVNDAPNAVDDGYTVAEDSGATVLTPSVLANDTDTDAGDIRTITANTSAANGIVNCTAADCTYTPNADFTGSDSFTYTITDGSGATDTATVTITVTPVNDAPDAVDDAVSVSQDAAATVIDVLANDTDIDTGTTLTVTAVTQPANGTVTLVGGVVSFTPAPGFVGTTTFTYTISDGQGGTDTATVTVTVDNVNDAPDAVDDGYTVAEDSGATLLTPSVLANDTDPDAGDTFTITANTNPANGAVSCTTTGCTYTPNAEFNGADSFTYTITDAGGATDTATVSITVTPVNDAPNAVDDSYTVAEDSGATVLAPSVLANDTDIDTGDARTITANTDPANGTVSCTATDCTYTPDADFTGTETFTYTITDGGGATDTATVTITVTPVNDAPDAVDDAVSVSQDASATAIDVLANDTDIDAGTTLAVTAVTQPANGTVTLVGGVVSFTPAPGFTGTTTFTYTISDGSGGTDTATVTVTVDNVNDAPNAENDSYTVAEDGGATVLTPSVLDNDTDADAGTTLAITANTGAANGTVTCSAIDCTYTPNADFNGSDSFTYTISDGDGGTDTATVTITVGGSNDAPSAVDDGYTVAEDSGATLLAPSVLDNDSDADGDTLSIQSNTAPANGTVACTASDCTYTPNANFAGSDAFTYTVSDGNGGTATATVTITVTPVNDGPDAVDDAFSVAQDAPATLLDVLANDTDLENDTLTLTAVTQPASGTVTFTATDVSFTPAPGFVGTTTFTYTIDDGNGGTDTATVTVTVDNVNDAPKAVDDSYTVAEDSGAMVLTPSVLANDTDVDAGTTLTVTAVTQPADGSVSFTPGDVSFTPNAGFNGATTFTYTIGDGNGGTATATVTVTVSGVNDAPDAVDDALGVPEDAPATAVDVLVNDTDADQGDSLSIVSNTPAANGTAACTPTQCSYQPNAQFTGIDSFTYTITDLAGGTDTATVIVDVGGTNDAPLATDDAYTVAEDSGATLLLPAVLANDSDPDGDTLSITGNTAPANGSVACTAADCTYTPNADFTGSDSFTYTIGDGAGGSDTATVTVTVSPVDDLPVANDDAAATAAGTPVSGDAARNDAASADGGNAWSLTGADGGATLGTVTMTADGSYTYTPDAGASGSDAFVYQLCDVDGDCDAASVTVTISAAPASADLSITKLADSLIPTTGGPIVFTIAVTNMGPSAVADAVVTDLLPDGYTFVSSATSQGVYIAGSGIWTVGTLANGATATLTVNATVDESGNYANTATVTSSIPDPDPSDNTATETPTPVQGAPVQADLAVEKTGPATIERGETLDFTIVLENHGPGTAVNARLVDPTPAGLEFVSTGGACSGAFPCLLGDLPGGASRTVVARYRVPEDYAGPDMIVNTVNALSDTVDPTPGDSSSSSSVVVQQGVVQPPMPPPAPVMVPVDARWAMLLMVGLLALFAGRGLRRERGGK